MLVLMCVCMWVLHVHVHSLLCVCPYAALSHVLVLMCMRTCTSYVLPRHVTNARMCPTFVSWMCPTFVSCMCVCVFVCVCLYVCQYVCVRSCVLMGVCVYARLHASMPAFTNLSPNVYHMRTIHVRPYTCGIWWLRPWTMSCRKSRQSRASRQCVGSGKLSPPALALFAALPDVIVRADAVEPHSRTEKPSQRRMRNIRSKMLF